MNSKKVFCLALSVALMSTGINAVAANVSVDGAVKSDTGVILTLRTDEAVSADVYAATYDGDGNLASVVIKTGVELVVDAINSVSLDNVTDGASVYVWGNNQNPLCDVYTVATDEPELPTEEPTDTPESPTEAPTDETVGDGIIHLKETEIDATGVPNVTIDGTIVTINAAGDYIIEGTLNDGQIVVSDSISKSEEVNIELRGVNVSCSDSAPFNGGGATIELTLAEDTVNTFTDTAKYTSYTTEKDPKGCVYSRRDLDIGGSGKLVVNANVKNGLVCGADLKIKKGANLEITAVNNAIKGDNGVEFTSKTGTVVVNSSGGDAIKSDAVIELDDGTLLIEPDKGYVIIEGGTFTLNATAGDGIQADNYCDISGGTVTITAGKEGIKANEVNLGATEDEETQMTDATTGEPVYVNGTISISGGTIDITAAEDGIKACEKIDISGGDITITANGEESDAIQVGENSEEVVENSDGSTTTTETVIIPGEINISGGTINITTSTDDAIVSRGKFIMTDGTITGTSTCDFMKVYDLIDISGGTINIVSGNDGIQSGKSLVETVDSTGETTAESGDTVGNINISGGNFTIKANGGHTTTMTDTDPSAKGIKSNTEFNISGGEFNIDSADDAIHSNYNITITGGTFDLATGDDGVHADYILTLGTENGADDDYTIDISTSYEGIEGSVINILSGTIYAYATDDGINAAGDYSEDGVLAQEVTIMAGNSWGPTQGADDTSPYGMLYIKGGKTYVEAYGDGMDSNGSVNMSDGVVIINGPTSGGNGVFDIGDTSGCRFDITGGTLIGAGASDMAVTPDSMTNGYFLSGKSSGGMGNNRPGGNNSSSSSYNAGTPVKITTSNGSIIFIPKVNSSWLFVTTPDMNSGGSFSASTVSSYSGGTQILGRTVNNVFYGLVEGAN